MSTILTGADGQHAYRGVVQHVLRRGRLRSPRGRTTLDAGCVIIELASPRRALPLGCGRDLNKNIAAAEAVQLIGAFSDPGLLMKATPSVAQYMDGDKFHGAYGERIGQQMFEVRRKLMEDTESRQAVVTLWDKYSDNEPSKHDYPCTVMLQFQVSPNAELQMTTVMRSNDVWLGLPYDMFQFTQLQMTLANSMALDPGMYRHIALSLHIYSEHVHKAERDLRDPTDFTEQPMGLGRWGKPFIDAMQRARKLHTIEVNDEETSSEQWYRSRFASYLG
jgi:thymidylate synthase